MKSNHSKKRRLNNNKNSFRKNTRLKRQNMTKKDKKKPKLSRKISRIQRGGGNGTIKLHSQTFKWLVTGLDEYHQEFLKYTIYNFDIDNPTQTTISSHNFKKIKEYIKKLNSYYKKKS